MGTTFEGYEIMLQGEAAILLSFEKYGKVSESDIVNDNKVFLENWMKQRQTKEERSFIQKSIQSLIEKGALVKGEKVGSAHIYSKSEQFYDVAVEILDVLFEAIDFNDENEDLELFRYMEGLDSGKESSDLEPDWVISWNREEIYFDFDLLERLVEMYVKMNK